jgi:hypothetical protein
VFAAISPPSGHPLKALPTQLRLSTPIVTCRRWAYISHPAYIRSGRARLRPAAALDSRSALAGQVISDLLVMRMIKTTAPALVPALARVSPIPFSPAPVTGDRERPAMSAS